MNKTEIKKEVERLSEIKKLIATACQSDAIALGEWCGLNAIWLPTTSIWHRKGDYNPYTTAQLYAIYLADKNKEGV